MKKLLFLSIIIMLIAACTAKKTEVKETGLETFLYNHVPMPMDTAQSLKYQWSKKKVLDSIQIDGMESMKNWELDKPRTGKNVATISLSKEKVFEGKSSIKFVCPTKQQVQLPNSGRYWGRENLTRKFSGQRIAQAQLEWVVGKNPFNQSEMFGEGYNFSTQYAAFPGDVTGGLPVGIETKLDSDIPYQPAAVLHN